MWFSSLFICGPRREVIKCNILVCSVLRPHPSWASCSEKDQYRPNDLNELGKYRWTSVSNTKDKKHISGQIWEDILNLVEEFYSTQAYFIFTRNNEESYLKYGWNITSETVKPIFLFFKWSNFVSGEAKTIERTCRVKRKKRDKERKRRRG